MFDTLTTAELYHLHLNLCHQINTVHDRMLTLATWTPTYQLLKAHVGELHETATAIYTEATRRDQENADAQADH
jgi:hypothetical protein